MKRIIIASKLVALFLLLIASPVIAQNSRFNQNQIDWLAKELGVSSADLAKKINKATDGRIKIKGTYWNLRFLEEECKKNAEKVNNVNVDPKEKTESQTTDGLGTTASNKAKFKKDERAIDMGLSVMWASCNLSDKDGFVPLSQDVGGYYAWGEIETKPKYTWDTYKWRKGPVFDYRETYLKTEDDVAFIKLGRGWRLPTHEEFKELIENSNIKQKEIKKIRGLLFTSKINGNSIFLPLSFYWCSNGAASGRPWCFTPTSTGLLMSPSLDFEHIDAEKGCSIRPVFDDSAFDDVCLNMVDNNFRKFCLNSYDNDKDGRVSLSEASLVEKIDVYGKDIHSLAGIEYFENLTFLDCRQNQLTQLDVSKNTKLKKLACNDNQLTQLDVSKNTLLEELGCNDNKLTQLDVSKNTRLKSFGCSYNQLPFLDVSNNTSLQQLFCEHNQLSKLNVSGCSALTKLSCENNQLTSLDISGATALEELVCNDNQLSNLDISRNSVLWSLICQNNKFANLDTSRNPKLSYIVLEKNSNQRESTKEIEEVWVSDSGSMKFYLYTDGTADVFVLGVGRDSKWEKQNGQIYVRGFGTTQAYVINQNGELYALESNGRLTRVKNSSSSPFATITGSDGVIMHKKQ